MAHGLTFPISREQIKDFLPHRDPMFFINEVTALGEDWIEATSFVDPASPFFEGHFPDLAIMPGVLLIETVAQAGALIVSLNTGLSEGSFIAFSGVEQAKFRRPVYPNETLTVKARITRARAGYYKFEGSASVGDIVAAELKFAATQMTF
ncbi:3-hydroxyacyl-ACP dehydratase FabZ [Litorimonas sp. RW-G-Af-16]|uniref:3-hydroxyacyl-ACP dehydratase FabZ n=1 Tax=Litorimonas sp. RW-G-Af-16 TaxID=3241168 RepID=UPI00390CCD6C